MSRILLGMSGGTDSSVCAMMLQEQGYEVVGVTFRFWEPSEQNHHLIDAQLLASRLGIVHYSVDARALFQQTVVDYFIREYMAGRTPVPCVVCNNQLKGRLLLQEADRLGIHHVATGHYVQIAECEGFRCIAKGVDEEKDQSFFLWGLGAEVLQRALFPLGNLTKQQVREYAARRGFEGVATKRDSIGVCFCPHDYHSFLRQHIEDSMFQEGDFIDETGTVMGRHQGFPFYTVGQRRGLSVQRRYPLFVKQIDVQNNQITLAPLTGMYRTSFQIKEMCVIHPSLLTNTEPLICRIRYRKQATPCRIDCIGEGVAIVHLLEPLESIAPGQSAVFYRGNCVVGGGIIELVSL